MDVATKKNITKEELGLIDIVRLNKAEKILEIRKRWIIGNRELEYHWRSRKNLWGRFGGGWNWELGIQFSKSTIILNCLVFRLALRKRAKNSA